MMPRNTQRGFLLIVAVVLIMVAAAMAAIIVTMTAGSSQGGGLHLGSTQALFAAESGIERALYQFNNSGTVCGSLTNTNVTVGQARYSTTGTLYNPTTPTTLTGAGITATDTTIAVASANGYAPRGRIRIGSEEIYYAAISGNNFTGAMRGAAGTTAAAHAAGASVYQNQCRIQSTGTVTASNTERLFERSITGASTKQGSFTTRTTNGTQSITGVGFQPKAVIFFWTRQTTEGFAAQNSQVNLGAGFATGSTNERAVSVTARDRQNNSDQGRRRSASNTIVLLTGGGPPTLAAQAGLSSLDADGFTLDWTTTDGNAYIVHYIALGGDITNAVANTFNLSTAGGNQAVTGVGFQPDFVMFLWSFTEAVDTNTAAAELGLGFARSSSSRGALVIAGRDNSGSNARKWWQQRTNSAILLITPTINPPNQDAIVDFVSMDADGFTVNKSNAPAASTPIFYLALKGGSHQVGAFNQPTATGNQTIAGVGFKPQQLMLASFNRAATVNVVTGGAASLGAARLPTSRGGVWYQDRSDNDPSDANSYTSTTDALTLAYGTAFGAADGNPAVGARADFVSFGNDGFTLNWTAADATARQVLYWAIGPTVTTTNIDWGETFP